jgi:hypothetical protein
VRATTCVALIACGSIALGDEKPGQIELWTRTAGQYGGSGDAPRARVVTIDLDQVVTSDGVLVDVQYGGRRELRYVAIDDLIRRYTPPSDTDTALLHFANGMAIPLPFRDRSVMARLRPTVARAIRVDGVWTSDLPPISRTDSLYFDVRPLRFHGNKLVVADTWHPALRAGSEHAFSPWRYADTLTGIEFVRDDAFMAQFDVEPAAHRGAATYGQACRFCHGARRVGAQFGWDFVEPLPIAEYRKKDASLYYHVKYRPADAVGRGVLMPALPFVTEKDASDLMAWLRALEDHPLRPYSVVP